MDGGSGQWAVGRHGRGWTVGTGVGVDWRGPAQAWAWPGACGVGGGRHLRADRQTGRQGKIRRGLGDAGSPVVLLESRVRAGQNGDPRAGPASALRWPRRSARAAIALAAGAGKLRQAGRREQGSSGTQAGGQAPAVCLRLWRRAHALARCPQAHARPQPSRRCTTSPARHAHAWMRRSADPAQRYCRAASCWPSRQTLMPCPSTAARARGHSSRHLRLACPGAVDVGRA